MLDLNPHLVRFAFDAAIRDTEAKTRDLALSRRSRNDALTLLARLRAESAKLAL